MSEEPEILDEEMVKELENEDAAEDTSAKGKTLTPAQWDAIVNHWEWDTKSGADMSREYGISGAALSKYFKRHGIVRGSKKAEAAKELALAANGGVPKPVTFNDKRTQFIEDTKNQSYTTATLINISIHQLIVQAKKNGEDIAKYTNDIKALRLAASTIQMTKDVRYDVLDVANHTDKEEITDLPLRPLFDDEVEAIKNRVEEAMGEFEVDMPDLSHPSEEDEVIETND
jgi:hypothetical protein